MREIARTHPDTAIVYPVHLNPNVQKSVRESLTGLDRIHLTGPLGYLPFVDLMDRSFMIIMDSGGIQEEAPSLGKPVLVVREETERPEAVEAGCAKLVGMDPVDIVREASVLLDDADAYAEMRGGDNPFGDGSASQRIVDTLCLGFQR